VLPLHGSTAEPLHVAAEPLHAAAEPIANPAADESAVDPLHVAANPVADGATLTETSFLCVHV
jgi:hypothetical protein